MLLIFANAQAKKGSTNCQCGCCQACSCETAAVQSRFKLWMACTMWPFLLQAFPTSLSWIALSLLGKYIFQIELLSCCRSKTGAQGTVSEVRYRQNITNSLSSHSYHNVCSDSSLSFTDSCWNSEKYQSLMNLQHFLHWTFSKGGKSLSNPILSTAWYGNNNYL